MGKAATQTVMGLTFVSLTLLDSVEKAIQQLENVKLACEEIYIDTDESAE